MAAASACYRPRHGALARPGVEFRIVSLPAPKLVSAAPQRDQSHRTAAVRQVEREVRALARQWTVEALEALVEIMRDTAQPGSVRVSAITYLLDRGWGRPRQAVEISGEGGIGAIRVELVDARGTDPDAA